MKLNLLLRRKQPAAILFLFLAMCLLGPATARAAFKTDLQGQNAGNTNWTTGPLLGWQELDLIPMRTLHTGGPATNQVIIVSFDHTKGTSKGIEDLTGFTNSSNVLITAGPTLSAPAGVDIWSYSYTITVTSAADGFVEFRARLSAGAHAFNGASLSMSLNGPGQLQINKPGATLGSPDMTITKSGPSQAKTNQIITYVINYTNKLIAADTALGVQVTDILPPQVTYVPGSGSKGIKVLGNTLTWDLGNLAPGKRGLLTYKVVVTNNISVTTTFANFAQINSSQDDANPADNSSSVTTTVVVTPTPLAIDDFYAIGKNTTLTIPAPGVLLNDSNALSAVLLSAPINGTLTFDTNGSFIYIPATNFLGTDIFAYQARNSTNISGPAIVTIQVTNTCFLVGTTNVTTTNTPGQCGAIVNYPPPTTTGDCAPVICTPPSGSFFPVGTNTVTCTNTDGLSASLLVTVLDVEPPAITCSSNLVLAANPGQCSRSNVTYTVTGSDNCPGAPLVQTAGLPSGSTFPKGTTTNRFSITDATGNSNTCSFTVTISGTQAPTITCPANILVSAAAGQCTSNVNFSVTATDACGSVTNLVSVPTSGSAFPAGVTTVTNTATDDSGNTSQCTFTVTVNDTQPPTITCPADVTVNVNSGVCFASGVVLGSPTAGDTCGVVTVTSNAPAQFPVGTNVVTWTATDASGNSATCQQRVIVRDNQGPTITCPANVVVNAATGQCASNVTFTVTATDLCGSVTNLVSVPASGSAFPVGVTTVTNTATDNSGNTSQCTFTVTVNDTQLPTITCPADVTINANVGTCFATGVVLGSPTASDNCGAVTVSSNAPAQFPVGTNLVTWTATDGSGNTTTCQQRVVVRETVPPAITCPADLTVDANFALCFASGVVLGSPTASDNCGGVTVTSNAPAQIPVGTNFVIWTATDPSGNITTCQQRVIVRENPPQVPAITCPADVTVNANVGTCIATGVVLGSPNTSDNCGVVTVSSNAPAQFPVGTNLVTWTATDSSGNTNSCQQRVIVRETVAPTITCPADVTVNVNPGTCFASGVVLGSPTASDNCGAVTVSSNAPAQFPVGTNVVTWTATDGSGNTTTCQQRVIVRDNQGPTITCPANAVVSAASGQCASNVVFTVTATDLCGSVTNLVSVPASGSAFVVGVTTVTNTATDASGNTSQCTFTVTVNDTQVPTITCPVDLTVNANVGTCFATGVALGSPTAGDNCGAVTVTSNAPAQFPVGTNLVTWTATDGSGNSATCQQRVIVRETIAPTITCPADVTVNANLGTCSATGVVLGSPTASDNCGVVTVTSNAPAQIPVGTNFVTWTATDGSGNSATCQQRVIVRENPSQVPTITCPADVTVNANVGTCFASGVALGSPSTSDNCGVVTVSSNAPAQFPVGTNLVTWTATDSSGNTNSCQQRVIVRETVPPTITCPADVTVNVNSGVCFASGVALGSPTASDNCGPVTVTSNAPAQFPIGTNLVTWTATDGSGNTTTCQQRVVVRDNQGPTITCPANVVVNAAVGQCASNVTFTVTANDLCGSVTNITSVPASGSAFPVGVTTVTNTARDNSGNTIQCTFTVRVNDTQPPVVTCSTNVSYNAPAGQTNLVVNFPTPTVTDNCSSATASCSPPSGSAFPLGTTTVTCTATDSAGNTATCSFTVTINPGNNPPVANNQSVATPEDIPLPITLTGSDADGNPLTFAIVLGPTNGVITGFNTNTGTLTYRPNTNFNGGDSFTFRVNDGATNSAPATVAITVTPVNDAPVTVNDSYSTLKNIALNISAPGVLGNDTDVETNALFALLVSNPTNGTLVLNATGSFLYTPNSNYVGSDAFTYRAYDSGATGNVATVTLTILATNTPPTAIGQSVSTAQNTPKAITLTGSDPDGNPLTFAIVTSPANGALSGLNTTNGAISYTPNPGFIGTDSFTFRVNDGTTNSSPATVSITVTPLADVAVFKFGPATVAPGASFVYTITVTNSGPSPATSVVVIDNLPTNVVFVSASAGGVFSNNVVSWPTLASLAQGAATNFTINVTAPTNGSFVNVGSASSTTPDPNASNNDGTAAGSQVSTTVTPVSGPQFGILQGTNVFNPQTGLFEQRVTVTNNGPSTVAAVCLLVGDIRSTNGVPRTNVFLYNATGTNVDLRPYVQYNAPLNPGQTVLLLLEFHVPDRRPFTNSLEAIAVLPTPAGTNSGAGVLIDRFFVDSRIPGDPRYVIEFASIPGRTYTIIYSDDGMQTWKVATPSVTANANRTQWYDDGPPKTESKPLSQASRFYRVILNP